MFEKTPYALGMYKRGSPDLILLRSSLNSEATVRKSLPQLLGPMPFAGTTRWRRMPLLLLAPRHLCERDRASRYPHSDLRSSRRSVKKQSRILRSPSLDLPHKANKNAPMQHRSMSGRELSASAASKSSASVTRRGRARLFSGFSKRAFLRIPCTTGLPQACVSMSAPRT